MQHSTKVAINIIASFTRVVINAAVTIIATRIALRVLGASDYGLYNLLAGTVALLSFINGALGISAQRFFSIAIGAQDDTKLNRYYNASLSIHCVLGVVIILLLLVIKGPLFNHVLNIEDGQMSIGMAIYDIMVISSAITVITIPYSAIMNAHEDLVMMAVSDIISCFIKLFAAVILLYIDHHLLMVYSLIMLGAAFVKAAIEFTWSKIKYIEVKAHFASLFDFYILKEMLGFVGWTTLGSFAVVVRNQGVAIVLNMFFGTVINTAYGIANQVNSLVLSFATTLTSVFSPVIIQSKGGGQEERMRSIAVFSSKLSFFLSSFLALPILVFLSQILHVWLGEYPSQTYEFCFLIVLSFLVLQLYPGINRAIYASGNIKGYQIALSVILVSILPIGYLLFRIAFPSYSILIVMLISQIGTVIATFYFGARDCGFNQKELYINVVLKPVFCFLFYLSLFLIIEHKFWGPSIQDAGILEVVLMVISYSLIILIAYTISYIFIVLNGYEKSIIKQMIKGLIKKR